MSDYPFTEAELLTRLRAGEKQAFVELVRAYHTPMKYFAAAIIGEAQAEETVQEAWLAVIRNLDSFQSRSSLKTWLFAIVGNEAKTRLRKTRREVSLDAIVLENIGDAGKAFAADRFLADGHWSHAPNAWHDDSPEALLTQDDFRRCLEKTLAAMPAAQRTALMLRDQDGLELDDICNVLGVSASNVRVLVHRARLRVYGMVEHFEETGTC
ncbi:MAG: sigma-70 family RNA polymerase sigma factor [Spongiibacteraceae bacterium]